MAAFRDRIVGHNPRFGATVVLATGVAAAIVFALLGLFEMSVARIAGRISMPIAFGGVPAIAGWICGRYRLGLPAAVASGVIPGIAFFVVVSLGAALQVGSFGGGDSPLSFVALMLTVPSLLFASVGFALAVAVPLLRAYY